jgi:lipoprotein-anchoring transpeptidase ErfK/SrfK
LCGNESRLGPTVRRSTGGAQATGLWRYPVGVPEANALKTLIAQKRTVVIAAGSAVVLLAVLATCALQQDSDPAPAGKPVAAPTESIVPAPPVPPGLEKVAYEKFQTGWSADPAPTRIDGISEGVHPKKPVAMYDKIGGKARAMADPEIARGHELVMPVVERKNGWVAVLVPSANRSIAWIFDNGDLEKRKLEDHIVIYKKAHKLVWYKNDKEQQSWQVTLGAKNTPTPLGRSYVLAQSALQGKVYAGEPVMALSSVPDDPKSVPTALAGAHTGIHTWWKDDNLGKDVSDGCIRLTKKGHQLLLREIEAGTPVTVLP